ncbi:MAG: citrate transporter, partial [Phycisphaerae bacterium]|nr:citrate transporter [Phycisphaerae bacterium]
GAARVLARSLIEGAQTVIPPVLLMIGIGVLIVALSTPPVQSAFRPLVSAVVPESRLGYIVLFSLAAPLALYRGPLNVWGMGLAVSATLLATTTLPPAAILCAILAAGMLQGVCDPTNTANVWIAGYQGITVNQILRYTLLPIWAAAIVAVVIFGLRFVGIT